MAAIYSGIHLKLKNPRTSWEDKLKLARFAWISSQCLLPNKEQVLFDWAVLALTKSNAKKMELPPEVVEGLWTYLDDILHSKKLLIFFSHGKTINLRMAIAQLIIERIKESTSGSSSVSLSTVLSCCQGIFSSPVLSVTFTTQYEQLVELLAKLCTLACSRLHQQPKAEPQSSQEPTTEPMDQQPITEPLSRQAFEVLLQVLNSYLTVQRQQANPNRVFTQVTTHLLQHLLLLRHLLTSRAWTGEDDHRVRHTLSREIRVKVDTVLLSAFFVPEHLPSYKEELIPLAKEASGGSKKGQLGKGPILPVNSILTKLCSRGYCDPSLHYTLRSSSLPLLLKFSLEAYCKGGDNKVLCFHLLTRLVTGLDLTEELTPSETFHPENWSLTLLAMENLLNQCLSGDVYNVAADRIQHGEAQLKFYRKVARLLLNHTQPGIAAWYRCLKVLLNLNHLILEPDLDELLSSAWVDSHCPEPRVRKAREALVSALLRTYTKLRQLPRLTQELLVVICRPAATELRQMILTGGVHSTLSTCLLDSPPSQSLEICSLVLESIESYILPDVERNTDMSLKVFSLSVLLHSVLFSLKTLDNSTPVPIVRQTQAVMEKILQVVKPVLQLCQSQTQPSDSFWCQKVLDSGLLLRYTWVEVDTLFMIHCSKYTSPATPANANILANITSLLSGVIVTDSDQVTPIGQHSSPMSQLLLKLLTLQQIKKVLLSNDLLAQSSTSEVLSKALQFIVGIEDPQLGQCGDQLWDRQVSSVDASTYPVAHWYVVTSNLPLLAPFLSESDMCHIADLFLTSLLLREAEDSSVLSVSLISKHLLQSLILVELPAFYSAVVQSVTQRIVGVLLSTSDAALACPSLLRFSELAGEKGSVINRSNGEVSEAPPTQKRLESLGQEILNSSTTGASSITLSETQTDQLQRLLQVIRALNPDGMSPEDFSGLFLLLLLMATDIQPHSDAPPAVTVQLLRELLSLMGCLLTGRNSHCVLKILHGSSLLESTMTALFLHSDRGLFQTADSSDRLAVLRAVQAFIESLVQLIIHRKSSVRLNLEKFTSYMFNSQVAVAAPSPRQAQPQTHTERVFSIQLLLASLTSLSQVMTSNLRKGKQLDETLKVLLQRTTAVMGPALQASLGLLCTQAGGSLMGQAFYVDVVTQMVKSELACCTSDRPQGGASETTTTTIQESLSHMGLYRSFSQQILREMCPSQRPMDFLISSLHFLSAYYSAVVKTEATDLEDLFVSVLANVHKLLSAPWMSVSEVLALEEPVEELLRPLVVRSTTEQFHLVLLLLRDGLDTAKVRGGSHREVLSAVSITKLLTRVRLPNPCYKALWLIAPQIISALVFIVKETSQETSLNAALTVPALNTLTAVLRQGEGMLSNPHHVTMVLGALQLTPLDHLPLKVYHATFEAVHETLFAVIQCHPQVMLKAAPSFLNCFYRLVASIMQEGRQKGEADRAPESDSEVLLKCARLVERMYSHIATTAEGFTTLSSFIVAQYISELQKVTIQPEVKAHLTEGVYRILDLCVEKDVKFLSSTLQIGLREVFSELYSSYTHYHKTQRQGEEKYTA